MYENLNKKQSDILNFIKYKSAEEGFPPTIREICVGVGIKSTSTVHHHLNKLEEKGYIRKKSAKNRALEVVEKNNDGEFIESKKTLDVPIVGQVTAGEPILATENIEDTFPIPLDFTSADSMFILNVEGESMIEAGILDGDKILVKQQSTANNGDIVVALLDDSATVKRYFKENDHVILQPENSNMDPIKTSEVNILGIVIGLYRFY